MHAEEGDGSGLRLLAAVFYCHSEDKGKGRWGESIMTCCIMVIEVYDLCTACGFVGNGVSEIAFCP